MKKATFTLLVLIVTAHSQYCNLIGYSIFAQDKGAGVPGTYLGLISSNKFYLESIMNKYGSYGSAYSSTSIFNQYSNFGSSFSAYSAFNDFAVSPPIIWKFDPVSGFGNPIGYLSTNKFVVGGTVYDPGTLVNTLNSGTCVDTYIPHVATSPDLMVDSIQVRGTIFKGQYDILGRQIHGGNKRIVIKDNQLILNSK